MLRSYKSMSGFTLMEAVMVIVITGILGALMVSFVNPLKGYLDATRRADLSDVADTTLRRMANELHTALPNSVRKSGSYLEFLPTTNGGRYRVEQDCSAACTGDTLDFSTTDTSFDVIGTLSSTPASGEEVVIYNLGIAGADAYAGDNVSAVDSSSTTGKVVFSSMKFPLEPPGYSFQIIGKPVTFACVGTSLWRFSGYTRQASQPTDIAASPLSTATSKARLATGVDCSVTSFVYTAGVTERVGIVAMRLKMSIGSESVVLQHQVHVTNAS